MARRSRKKILGGGYQVNLSKSASSSNYYATKDIVNGAASQMVFEGIESILTTAKKTLALDQTANICIVLSILASFLHPVLLLTLLISVGFKFYVRTAGLVTLEYKMEAAEESRREDKITSLIKLSESSKIWRIMRSSRVVDTKYTGGASRSVDRKGCRASQVAVFPFKANVPAPSFKSKNETLIFLPDALFVVQGHNVGALNYSDISISSRGTRFHESGNVPNDAKVVGQTWQYVNKSGGPDRRFKNNRKVPICLYTEYALKSSSGLDTVLLFSKNLEETK